MDIETAAALFTAYKSRSLNQTVSPKDQMWQSGPDWYWSVGQNGLTCVLSALQCAWISSVKRVLDLPCGHGRVGRHLAALFPDAEIFGCDLDHDGVAFCASDLGMTPVYSQEDLTKVDLPKDLDVIWIGSLFTHVDEERTTKWLAYLFEHLALHGVLVATFHGLFAQEFQKTYPFINANAWQEIESQFERSGFGYAPYTEFDMGDYGVSLSRPSKLIEIATAIPGSRVVSYVERGWANNHDVLALTRNDRMTPF